MQRYSPSVHLSADMEVVEPAMREDSEKGDWYHRADVERLEAKAKKLGDIEDACRDLVFWAGQQPAATYSYDKAFKEAYNKAADYFRDEWEKHTSQGKEVKS